MGVRWSWKGDNGLYCYNVHVCIHLWMDVDVIHLCYNYIIAEYIYSVIIRDIY